jgi:hypothetical protein
MKKVIRLTESDLVRLVKKVIKESEVSENWLERMTGLSTKENEDFGNAILDKLKKGEFKFVPQQYQNYSNDWGYRFRVCLDDKNCYSIYMKEKVQFGHGAVRTYWTVEATNVKTGENIEIKSESLSSKIKREFLLQTKQLSMLGKIVKPFRDAIS